MSTEKQIKVIICKPGEGPRRAIIGNSEMSIQRNLEGFIHEIKLDDCVALTNEVPYRNHLHQVQTIALDRYTVLYGTVIFCGKVNGEYEDYPGNLESFNAKYPKRGVPNESNQ